MSVTSACFEPFNLTRNVFHWNSGVKGSGGVNEKWMKEIVFFGMIIIPVHMFSALLDAFIFNPIQFWTGGNPVKASGLGGDGSSHIVQLGEFTMTGTENEQRTTVTYERNGILERRAIIETSEAGYRLVDESGALLAESENGWDGSITLFDRDCQVITRWSRDQLLALAGERR